MTQKLFGLDIAGIVADGIASAGGVRDCTLTKTTPGSRTPGSLTAGNNPATTAYNCKGFVETKEVRRGGTLVGENISVVTILGDTVSSGTVAPEVNDTALIDGTTWNLTELVSADPAGAVYEFEAEAS